MDLPASELGLVRFGAFELDLRSGELRKAGARLNLPDQPLQLLTALLEHPGVGPMFQVTHFIGPGRQAFPDVVGLELSVSGDRVVLPIRETTGSI